MIKKKNWSLKKNSENNCLRKNKPTEYQPKSKMTLETIWKNLKIMNIYSINKLKKTSKIVKQTQ